jgi:hypothetical protein
VLAEAVVRGYKLGLLTTADYNNLCQCETLEDIKLYLVRGADWPLCRPGPAAAAALDLTGFLCSLRITCS